AAGGGAPPAARRIGSAAAYVPALPGAPTQSEARGVASEELALHAVLDHLAAEHRRLRVGADQDRGQRRSGRFAGPYLVLGEGAAVLHITLTWLASGTTGEARRGPQAAA